MPDADLQVRADGFVRQVDEVLAELVGVLPVAQALTAIGIERLWELLELLVVEPEARQELVLEPSCVA